LAASNMILRGDGKANLHQGSCFDPGITSALRGYRGTVGMVNPPYSKSKADLHELRFVDHMLDALRPGATGIAIVPVSCATVASSQKGELLKKHTLEAVMSMPLELFYPVGVITCIMVFTAKKPHVESNRKTWFGYWRDDGFSKVKNLGRIDVDDEWPAIRDRWISAYRNREVHAGESVMAHVSAADEWIGEAYLETDYSGLTPAMFEAALRDYAIFKLRQATSVAGDDGTS